MMQISRFILPVAVSILTACSSHKETQDTAFLDKGNLKAMGTYFATDNEGKPVLCWTSQSPTDSLYRLQYAIYDEKNNSFEPTVTVPVSTGTSTSAESMAKVAFKKDGTIIAVFAKRFINEQNPYAGAIYYSLSADKGKTWSKAQFLHSDTLHTYGRSFFDIATLKNGEVAAVWLDGRFGKKQEGSALFFAKTSAGKGFGKDSLLNGSTCECCRTDLLCDENGKLHIAYRSIIFPSGLASKQVRDMVYISSDDDGTTFSKERVISNDNWQIEGCPHSGPSLAQANNKISAAWFTAAGGNSGIYCTSLENGAFSKKSLITVKGRHPQLSSLPNGQVLAVYEEESEAHTMQHAHEGHGKMKHRQTPSGKSKIVLKGLGKDGQEIVLSNGNYIDHHAAITALNKGALIAWIREENSKSFVCYLKVNY